MPDSRLLLGWLFLPFVFVRMWIDLGFRIASGEVKGNADPL